MKDLLNVKYQKSSDIAWIDEKGTPVPYNRTTALERLTERQTNRLLQKSLGLNESLVKFKHEVAEICREIYDKAMEENATAKDGKGNFTCFNFDRSIKVEVAISERIEFDDLKIQSCRQELKTYIEKNVKSADDFGQQLIDDAFTTTKGKLDAKKVMSLLRYRPKIKDTHFQRALDLLEESVRRPSSKTYFRIFAKDSEGKYQLIDLNFSSL